jgi:hypothetical protein
MRAPGCNSKERGYRQFDRGEAPVDSIWIERERSAIVFDGNEKKIGTSGAQQIKIWIFTFKFKN